MQDHYDEEYNPRIDEFSAETKEIVARLLAKSEQLIRETTELSGKMASLATERIDERQSARRM
jgi:hypothetical protein